MLHNDEVRGQLDQTKSRHQDVVMLLQDNLRRYVGLVSPAVAENFVKRMFTKKRLPGQNTIRGYTAIASYASPEILQLMVRLPFEVPGWFWRVQYSEFLKLSGIVAGSCVFVD